MPGARHRSRLGHCLTHVLLPVPSRALKLEAILILRKRPKKASRKVKCVGFFRRTDAAPERLRGPDTVLNWPSGARSWPPLSPYFHEDMRPGRRTWQQTQEAGTPPGLRALESPSAVPLQQALVL